MSACMGFAGAIFGHAFEPRYSVMERENKNFGGAEGIIEPEDVRRLSVIENKVYLGDVCQRCGLRSGLPTEGKGQP